MLVIALPCVTATGESGQLTYSRGQNIVAAFEGWERGSDGTTSMVFSYFNRNYEEVLDVPIGPANNIEPGGPDQGQPTFFAPNRHKYVFRVKVPSDWGTTKKLVWTLTSHGNDIEALKADSGAKDVQISALKAKVEALEKTSRVPASANDRTKRIESENAQLKAYLCAKDPAAVFCK